jgi:hypothetical protein
MSEFYGHGVRLGSLALLDEQANLVFALSIGRIQDSPLLLPDGGDTRINAWSKR